MIRVLVTLVLLYLAIHILAATVRGILRFIRQTVQEELGKTTSFSGECKHIPEE